MPYRFDHCHHHPFRHAPDGDAGKFRKPPATECSAPGDPGDPGRRGSYLLIIAKVLALHLPLGEGWGEGIYAKTFATIDTPQTRSVVQVDRLTFKRQGPKSAKKKRATKRKPSI